METSLFFQQFVLFVVMFIVGLLCNPMNVLANEMSDIYLSTTLIYSGLLMASNMIWSHQIVHYITHGYFSIIIFVAGIILTTASIILLRNQLFVTNKQWLKRMIGHHSTAITTTKCLLNNDENFNEDGYIFRLAKDIVYNQEREILFMKNML
jgi:hypothetical protein